MNPPNTQARDQNLCHVTICEDKLDPLLAEHLLLCVIFISGEDCALPNSFLSLFPLKHEVFLRKGRSESFLLCPQTWSRYSLKLSSSPYVFFKSESWLEVESEQGFPRSKQLHSPSNALSYCSVDSQIWGTLTLILFQR